MFFWRHAKLNGWIDVVDQFHVAGWAAFRKGVVPILEIRIDGIKVGTATPKYVRPGLVGGMIGLGFDYSFPSRVAAGATIEVCDARGRSLPNSPQSVPAYTSDERDLSGLIGDLSTPLPDETLIFLVNGHRDRRQYAQSRRETVPAMLALLKAAGVDFAKFRTILDFGCGCGRILAGWEHRLPPGAQLFGCDINPALIAFCRDNIPFAETWVSSIEPPLERIVDGQTDFVYAASVFTHVTLPAAKAWAVEMKRIVRPGGILMMSYHGGYFEKVLGTHSRRGLRQLKRTGFHCYLHGTPEQTFAGSNDYATYMTAAFIKGLFGGFERIYLREGLLEGPHTFASYQDIAIFRRHADVS